ncbi:hypothetical protein RV12_GL000174 [Enterococcus quebecensis]|nr:hypothetical protein RV12_GL000174 [Enterococcus quebecensis]
MQSNYTPLVSKGQNIRYPFLINYSSIFMITQLTILANDMGYLDKKRLTLQLMRTNLFSNYFA